LHRIRFSVLAELDVYLAEHGRLEHHVDWRASTRLRAAWRDDPFTLVRPIRYEVLERR
jgi:hypothetical protein